MRGGRRRRGRDERRGWRDEGGGREWEREGRKRMGEEEGQRDENKGEIGGRNMRERDEESFGEGG